MRYNVARIVWILALVVLVVDFALYMRQTPTAPVADCDLSALGVEPQQAPPATAVSVHDNLALQNTSTLRQAATATVDDIVLQNTSALRRTPTSTLSSEFCHPGSPCLYPDKVDFRIIVMTYNRKDSLLKLLKSLNELELDGDSAALEIFIDRSKSQGFHKETRDAAEAHAWGLGVKRVHVWEKHVGIYGQWIDSWKPREGEIALILEDDMSVSKFCYRWLKAAHSFYGNRTDISGYTLQSSNVKSARGRGNLSVPKDHVAFLYRVLGSWGFSPHPDRWHEFQEWYYVTKNDTSFHPYVEGIVMTRWYKTFERRKRHHSMWTMWHIWFTNQNNLFCLVHNLKKFSGLKNTALGVNRQEPGLHFSGKAIDNTKSLLVEWKKEFVQFSNKTIKLNYNGAQIKDKTNT